MSDIGNKNKMYFDALMEGLINIHYIEENEGEPRLDIEYIDANIKESIDEEDFASYVSECLLVASWAGFEAPTEYYKTMQAFVQEGSAMKAMEDFQEYISSGSI